MQLTTLTARYLRRKQPQQFEPAEAEISATFVAPEGTTIGINDVQKFYDAALGGVKNAVMAKLGGAPAEPVIVEGLKTVAAEGKATPVADKPAAAKTAAAAPKAAAPVVEAAADKPKPRGRPPKATPAATKPATDDFGDPVAADAAEVDEFGDAALPAGEEPGDDEFAENEVKPMTTKELQEQISALVQSKQTDGNSVRAILLEFGAQRSADTKEADRAPILAKIKAAIAAKTKK